MRGNCLPVRVLLLFLFFISCDSKNETVRYLPEKLPSEDAIKRSLSSDENLAKLRKVSEEKGISLEEWKEAERNSVTNSEISGYWKKERKSFSSETFDTDAIEKGRDAIRIRLVWSRMFHEANLHIKDVESLGQKNLLSRLNLKSTPRILAPKAKWTIVEWSDFHCTFCKQTHPHTQKILETYQNQITYYHKDYPLDADTKEGALPLAVSRCLWEKEPSHYLRNTQAIYDHVRKVTTGDFLGLGTCNPSELKDEYYDKVQEDYREALGLGITSIPTFWVNGRWVVGSLDKKTWERLLRDTAPK